VKLLLTLFIVLAGFIVFVLWIETRIAAIEPPFITTDWREAKAFECISGNVIVKETDGVYEMRCSR